MGAEFSVGIEAAALLHEADARQLERGDLPSLEWRHTTLDVSKGARTGHALDEPLLVLKCAAALERFAEGIGRRLLVVDLDRNGVDGVGVDAVREQAPVTIDDLAALGWCRDGSLLLALGAGDQV